MKQFKDAGWSGWRSCSCRVVDLRWMRAALVPDGFGKYGHYRAGAIVDARSRPLKYAAPQDPPWGARGCAEDQLAISKR
jgi:hypothetical protein